MIKYTIGDFVEITANRILHTNLGTSTYIIRIIELDFIKKRIILPVNSLFSIKGIILKTNINNEVFTKHTYYIRNNKHLIKKVTNSKLIEELTIKYNVYLLKES